MEKSNPIFPESPSGLFNVMLKRTTILVLLLCMAGMFASGAFGQNTKINFKVQNASFQEAVNILQKESGYYFFYKSEDIPSNLKVTVNLKNADINEVMGEFILQWII